jgi:hypothetical protein
LFSQIAIEFLILPLFHFLPILLDGTPAPRIDDNVSVLVDQPHRLKFGYSLEGVSCGESLYRFKRDVLEFPSCSVLLVRPKLFVSNYLNPITSLPAQHFRNIDAISLGVDQQPTQKGRNWFGSHAPDHRAKTESVEVEELLLVPIQYDVLDTHFAAERLLNGPPVCISNPVDPACKPFHIKRLQPSAPLGQYPESAARPSSPSTPAPRLRSLSAGISARSPTVDARAPRISVTPGSRSPAPEGRFIREVCAWVGSGWNCRALDGWRQHLHRTHRITFRQRQRL